MQTDMNLRNESSFLTACRNVIYAVQETGIKFSVDIFYFNNIQVIYML